MEVRAKGGKLKAALENEAVCQKRYGRDMTKKIMMRLGELGAADSLADFWPPNSGPERCHELKGDLAGTFSMDLKQPYLLPRNRSLAASQKATVVRPRQCGR
jgi:proteic killer suppression protein